MMTEGYRKAADLSVALGERLTTVLNWMREPEDRLRLRLAQGDPGDPFAPDIASAMLMAGRARARERAARAMWTGRYASSNACRARVAGGRLVTSDPRLPGMRAANVRHPVEDRAANVSRPVEDLVRDFTPLKRADKFAALRARAAGLQPPRRIRLPGRSARHPRAGARRLFADAGNARDRRNASDRWRR